MGDISRYTHLTIPANELLNALTVKVDRKDMPATSAMRQFQEAFGDQYKGYIGGGLRAIMAGDVEKSTISFVRALNAIGRRNSGAILALSPSAILQNRYGGMANMAAWLRARLPQDRAAAVAGAFMRIGALPQGLKGAEVKALMENGYLSDRWSGKSLRLALLGGEESISNLRMFREFDRWSDKLNRPLVAREMANSVAAFKALTQNGFSAEEAVALVKPGDWLDFGACFSQPDVFDRALAARKDQLRDVRIRNCLSMKPRAFLEQDPEGAHFACYNWHFSGYDRRKHDQGLVNYLPCHLGEIPDYYRRFLPRTDIAVLRAAPMDAEGYFNLGPVSIWHPAIVETAKTLIIET
jgi:hypothetical protein